MARLIKKAEIKVIVKKLTDEYEVGETVSWNKTFHDGRSYETHEYIGEIVKINRSTVDVKIKCGDIYRVHRDELN
jgi:ribosomal protein L21E